MCHCARTGRRLAYEGMNEASPIDRGENTRIVWLAVLLFLGILAIAAYWYPIQRISQYDDINYNEGWNTYRADMAGPRDPLYRLPPRFTVTNYPPLSFYLLGFLGKLMGSYTAAGRLIALMSCAFLVLA